MKVKRVLLIEDDEITTFLNQTIISSTGVSEDLVSAANGQEGLEYLLSLPAVDEFPNLILMDLNMPVLNGFGFLEEYQKLEFSKSASTKIVVLSTSTHDNDLRQIKELGVTTFLEKPLTTDAFLEVVKNLSAANPS
ncbi:response regulator [Rufibacter roseus]|uniref:Response regulator n=1 Tax=Rufibacter roseus TaxID=1567108 RepID=A0ABW2DJG6_9BACT|nr:response regulator [Rufibacter roseus]